MAFLSLHNLLFRYPNGEFSLAIPSLEVERARTCAIVGPSGSGKTTLLNLIAGIELPESGIVQIDNRTVSTMKDADRRAFRLQHIGFVFQDFGLVEYLDVIDNILYPFRLSPSRTITAELRERAFELADSLGLAHRLRHPPARLSHGEKQRVALCRALLPQPSLILADEATGNLDPRNKQHILDLLLNQVKEHGATLVAVTHDLELVSRFDSVVDFGDLHVRRAA